jgi:electron transport complex protein RnfB
MTEQKNKSGSRRDFVKTAGKLIVAVPVLALPVILSKKTDVKGYVWQIDPYKCTSCEQCRTACVMTPSAVKCTNAFPMCGYCDFCPGFLRQGAKTFNTAADEKLCDGCSKCVKACANFGNGSLYLQIMHNLCVNCNQCRIARICPSDAVIRVPSTGPYLRKELKS